jgi:hypothetical protein
LCITTRLLLFTLAPDLLELTSVVSPLAAAAVAAPSMGRRRQGAAGQDNATGLKIISQFSHIHEAID